MPTLADVLRGLAMALAALLFGLGLLALFRAPLGALWKPAVAATEWGHVLALLSLAIAVASLLGGSSARERATAALAAAAALLLLTPLVRALSQARGYEQSLSSAFGQAAPRERPGANARPGPLVLGDLLSVSSPEVRPTRHLFRQAGDVSLFLDLYRSSDTPSPPPVVVVIHGGSWNSGDSSQLAWLNGYLAARGYAVAAIHYRLAPQHTFPAQRDDVLAAVGWLGEHASELGIDASRMALLGRSAGGQLALLAAYAAHDPRVRGVIALYAPTDLNWSWTHPTNPLVLDSPKVLREYLGGTPAEVKERFDEASPLGLVTPSSPPTLLVHGSRDELVFAEQSRRLDRRLAEAGVAHLLLELPWATHGCDANPAGPGGQITTWAVERFLAAVFSRPASPPGAGP